MSDTWLQSDRAERARLEREKEISAEVAVERLRSEVEVLRERVDWMEAALEMLLTRLDREAAHWRDPRAPQTNPWGFVDLGRQLNKEMLDKGD